MLVHSIQRGYVDFHHPNKPPNEYALTVPPFDEDAKLGRRESGSSVVLYATSGNEVEAMFIISTSDDDVRLEGSYVRKAHGYATHTLDPLLPHKHLPVFTELSLLVCGFALFVAEYLRYGTEDASVSLAPKMQGSVISADTLCRAADYLFAFDSANRPEHFNFCAMEKRKAPIPRSLDDLPPMVRDHFNKPASVEQFKNADGGWYDTRFWMMDTTSLLLAFCHVTDLATCGGLPLTYYGDCTFSNYLNGWDHQSTIPITPEVWFRVIIQRMDADSSGQTDAAKAKALISKRGWSIFVNTLGLLDPSNLSIGGVGILAGVPMNDGIVKHCIIDSFALRASANQRMPMRT